ncbi:hypothetical protein G7Y89_g9063 [Cudoniella acicularis]|uniref:Zn(2)-C6 fungal-type domain-containing protein n=1 Tax=Cudoniella acicularis TaxID=354080 RepID=A0A8H4RFE1_9HELO|nr:hypothetical protein G7Y89_g9063 [Cudoniella acicularis]
MPDIKTSHLPKSSLLAVGHRQLTDQSSIALHLELEKLQMLEIDLDAVLAEEGHIETDRRPGRRRVFVAPDRNLEKKTLQQTSFIPRILRPIYTPYFVSSAPIFAFSQCSAVLYIQSLPSSPRRSSPSLLGLIHTLDILPTSRRTFAFGQSSHSITATATTMSAFTPPGNNYPPIPSANHPNPNLHAGSPSGVETSLPVHPNHSVPPPYIFEGQPQQQQHAVPYSNGHTNGHGDEHQQQSQPAPPSASGGDGQKGNRLRKACDSCSIRKVKCDESGPPCRACHALEIPCTFDRPSRRRGPPNRHAEAIKKRRLESPSGPGAGAGPVPVPVPVPGAGTGSFSSPTSPNNVAATLASFSSHAVLNAESICPFSTLELLVDDFFTYIHPLCPFPHEPSFRAAFKHREDLNNPTFFGVACFYGGNPCRVISKKTKTSSEGSAPRALVSELNGYGYLDKELSVYDAATSYFLGLSAAYTFQWRQCRLYFGETLTIARVLGAHKVKDPGFLAIGGLPTTYGAESGGFDGQAQPIDFIRQEIGRRIFWIMFVGIRSMQQLGASFGELLIPPSTPNEPYPPFPMEVDDEYIFVDHVDQQPPGVISKLTGFNMGVRVYLTVTPLATMEMAYGIDEVFDWNRQKRVLEECLRSVKQVLDIVPPELMLRPGANPGEFESPDRSYFPPVPEFPGVRSNGTDSLPWSQNPGDSRRKIQFEIQKANIYASQLGTRSYIVEKYWNLQESYERMKEKSSGSSVIGSPGLMATGLDGILSKQAPTSNYENIEAIVMAERENIVKDLLQVLASINQVNMEPNGGSFVSQSDFQVPHALANKFQINKIRQIASTLIDTPQIRKGPLAIKAEEYLGRFLDVLMKLERVSPGIKTETGEIDEEEELRNWADLREYQLRFAQAGGFINEIG